MIESGKRNEVMASILRGECHLLTRVQQENKLFSHWYWSRIELEHAEQLLRKWQQRTYSGDSRSLAANPNGEYKKSAKRLRQRYEYLKALKKAPSRGTARCWLSEPDCEHIMQLASQSTLKRRYWFAGVLFKLLQFAKALGSNPSWTQHEASRRLVEFGIVPLPQKIFICWCDAHQVGAVKSELKRLEVARLVQGANSAAARCEHWRIAFRYTNPDGRVGRSMQMFSRWRDYIEFVLRSGKLTERQLRKYLGQPREARKICSSIACEKRLIASEKKMREQHEAWLQERRQHPALYEPMRNSLMSAVIAVIARRHIRASRQIEASRGGVKRAPMQP